MNRWNITNVDLNRNLIYVDINDRNYYDTLFRKIESNYSHRRQSCFKNKPIRIIIRNAYNVQQELIMQSINPTAYSNWDRRYNVSVTTRKWHGVEWDILKGNV